MNISTWCGLFKNVIFWKSKFLHFVEVGFIKFFLYEHIFILFKKSVFRFYTDFVNFFPKYFTRFDAVVTGMILILFFGLFIVTYKHLTFIYFCLLYIFVLCALNSCTSSSSFLVDSSGHFTYRMKSSASKDSYITSFSI